jgi:hypothetical protein
MTALGGSYPGSLWSEPLHSADHDRNGRPEMTFDEEKQGWAFASAEGLETRIAACEKLAETEAQREELASMRRILAEMRAK